MDSEVQKNIRKMEQSIMNIKNKETSDIFKFEYVRGAGVIPIMVVSKESQNVNNEG